MPLLHTCGPDTALVKSGACLGRPTIVPGGFVFSIPFIQQVQRLNLAVMTLEIVSPLVYTLEGVPLSVSSIAQVKINRTKDGLETAAGQFLGLSVKEIESIAQQTLEGHQRSIMGTLTVEEIYQDRKKFAKAVRDVAGTDLTGLGLDIVSYTIKDVKDDEGYLDSLGRKRTAEVKRDARIGEAEAERDAVIKVSEAKRHEMSAKFEADIKIADSKKAFELQSAAYDQEVNSKKAEAALSYELQAAKTRQDIKKEEMEISIVEKKKMIEIELEEVKRREKELEATVKKPAEAEKKRLEIIAEANRQRVLEESKAASRGTQLVGEAQALVIKAVGVAEATKMKAKAEAWKHYTDGAYIDMIIQNLPDIAAQMCAPLSKTDKIVIVSTDHSSSPIATKVSNELTDLMAHLPPVASALTGADITEILKKYTQNTNDKKAVTNK